MGKAKQQRVHVQDPELVVLMDRVRTAVRTLRAAGVRVRPDIVLKGAGLEFHTRRAEFLPMIAAVTEEAADG